MTQEMRLNGSKGSALKILFVGGSHPRHLYYLNRIAQRHEIVAAIVEKRGSMLPSPPAFRYGEDKRNWHKHFNNRAAKELEYFGDVRPNVQGKVIPVDHGDLNSMQTALIASWERYDVCLVFGCGMIRDPLLSVLPEATFNLHLGLSPRYRGAATLFWPFYFLEPNWAGTTLHRIVHEPDAGDVVSQARPMLEHGDTIHDVACRAVIAGADETLRCLDIMREGRLVMHKQKATGKNFLASDFRPEHLRLIYSEYNDRIVDYYLSGALQPAEPRLYVQPMV
jgi:methionyl-tRNA formyltransferase